MTTPKTMGSFKFSRARAIRATLLALLVALGACSRRSGQKPADGADSASSAAALEPPPPSKAAPSPRYAAVPATSADDVLTYHNNAARTGLDPNETLLTPAGVNSSSFGKLFSDSVDGFVYAQPLYVAGVAIPGKGRRNVVYVATENNTIYAFDADSAGVPLWQAHLGTPVPSSAFACGQIVPRVGITATPVIDLPSGTLYVEAMVQRPAPHGPSYAQQLHALDLATGAEKLGGPATLAGSVPGKGAGSKGGRVAFNAFLHLDRPGLALSNGVIYMAFGSHCDLDNYHGWVLAYGAAHLRFRAAFNVTPNGSQGAIWQTGDAPAVDSAGHVYVLTGNGTFDAGAGGLDYGDSFLKLGLAGNALRPLDFFTPHNQQALNDEDLDVGSGGPILLPPLAGSSRRLVVGAGKEGVLYVVDRNHMGGFRRGSDSQIVGEIRNAMAPVFSTPADWNGRLYVGSVSKPIEAFAVTGAGLSPAPVSQSPNSFDYPGATPSVSSNGAKDGIVWALDTSGYVAGGSAVLHAYDADNLARQLYASPAHGAGGPGVKFTTPTIAHGRVYFGTQNSLEVYGLRKP